MLFAACSTAAPKVLQHTTHTASNLGQQQLTTLQQLKDQHAMSLSPSSSSSSSGMPTPLQMSPKHQVVSTGTAVAAAAVAVAAAARANEEAKEAMRKLDAKLVAYLAGETKLQPKQRKQSEQELELNSEIDINDYTDEFALEEFEDPVEETVENITREELQLFRRIKSVKLQLEALTLEPEGTKRMELLQNETRPIFTVECQLSHELIKHVPRYEMFHIMQFESEKFHSLTQCTRFGQEAQRDVNLTPLIDELDCMNGNNNNNNNTIVDMPNFGRIHFTVWWREPGTCLNEMLGMGVFELRELYDAALLEQCKRITIQRRGVPLAYIYLKINLLLCASADTNNNSTSMTCEAIAIKQHPGGDKQQENTKTAGSGAGTDVNATNVSQSSAAAAATASTSSNTKANETNTKDNNTPKVDTDSIFDKETMRVRLLTGLVCACEVRQLQMCANREYHLVCDRFWKAEQATAKSMAVQQFYYQEQFAVVRDEQFLNCVKGKQLKLKIWDRPLGPETVDGNGNPRGPLQSSEPLAPVGVVLLPLHQFYIAFSNEIMVNRLVTEKLPVISVDAWSPIIGQSGEKIGEIKCLLAIGSEDQINYLKQDRGFRPLHADMFNCVAMNTLHDPLYPNLRMPLENIERPPAIKPKSIRPTVELMEMLQKALQKVQPPPLPARTVVSPAPTQPTTTTTTAAPPARDSNEYGATQPVIRLPERTFQFELFIRCAAALALNPAAKGKGGKHSAKRSASKRFPPGEAPSTYVTFQADACLGGGGPYKSHEGNVYATEVAERSTHPNWSERFLITVGAEYLENPKQNFILKLWKKANVPPGTTSSSTSTTTLVPKPIDDAIIGFIALDLSTFLHGLYIGGIFNVIDFNGRINGQLQLHAKPIDGWYARYLAHLVFQQTQMQKSELQLKAADSGDESAQDPSDGATEDPVKKFGSAIHKAVSAKLEELNDISQRLRMRLSDITGEPLPNQLNTTELNDWRPLNCDLEELSIDNEVDEFERDINSSPSDDENVPQLVKDMISVSTEIIKKSALDVGDKARDVDNAVGDRIVEETVDDNKSDKTEILISKTAPGAADSTVE
ncbi:uncharacterized protein LOC129240141 isoform X1 [Anastrepha obliqua]|uniref:uncharacterized protein LOC129240141 isoform X1 n=1 Tax=Anastrepha obliqua TaxID=95512 RepID=UPI00240A2608|nr:uncharacterized protein LOC129240141 isoform X1 [Anastrepha obliqua]XP_054731674.1 uncharacterized protein LOC129240141 isoform X1 [Anastrepha obliqua]